MRTHNVVLSGAGERRRERASRERRARLPGEEGASVAAPDREHHQDVAARAEHQEIELSRERGESQ